MRHHEDLEFEYEFKTHNSAKKNHELTEIYFKEAKYIQTGNFFELKFTKGSVSKNLLTTNPLSWKNNFVIRFSDTMVDLQCYIDTRNRLVSQAEVDCWEGFIRNYKNSLLQEKNLYRLNKELVSKSKKSTFRYLLYGIFITIILLAGFGFLADYFQLNPKYVAIPTVAFSTIVLFFIQLKMDQNRINKP